MCPLRLTRAMLRQQSPLFKAQAPALLSAIAVIAAGAQLLQALENGVYEWTKLEGRFPQARAGEDGQCKRRSGET